MVRHAAIMLIVKVLEFSDETIDFFVTFFFINYIDAA